MAEPSSLPRLPDHQEELLLRFDADWNQPGVEQLRAACGGETEPLFILELLRIDAHKRIAAGLAVVEADYLQAFPQLEKHPELLQKLREITFTPVPVGDSILRALAATTPVLPVVNLPADPQATTQDQPASAPPEHRYRFEGEIARGGMGAVLRGRDEDLGREIAVKVILQNHAGKTELLQRFVEEAQIAGQLQHPGITPVYELGRFPDQRPYFTMKLVRGQTLAKLLKDRVDPATERPRFLKIFEQICQTLAYAHTRKVIHRDLKPHNIMVGSFGEVQVMDWGLAKVLNAPTQKSEMTANRSEIPEASEGSVQTKRSSGQSTDIPNTQAGSVLGTPAYMAPEQARGDIDQLDERADVFGLGAILCEILTGKPPYVGENGMEIYRQAVDADLTDALSRLDHCKADAEIVALAKRCLSANREDRFRDASALTKELTGYLHSVEERLKQAELTAVEAKTKAEEESKRRRITFRLAAAILLTLLAGLAGSLWQMKRAMDAEELARKNEATAKSERDQKEEQRKRATDNEVLARQERDRAEQEKAVATTVRDFLQNSLIRRASAWEQANLIKPSDKPSTVIKHDVTVKELLTLASQEFSVDTIVKKFPQQPQIQADILETIGEAFEAIGNYDKAILYVKSAQELREKHFGQDHPITLGGLTNLAFVYLSSSKLSEACSTIIRGLNRFQDLLEKPGQQEPANLAMDAILNAMERRLDLTRFTLPAVTFGVTDSAMAVLQVGQALPRMKKLDALARERYGPDHRRSWYAHLLLGFSYHGVGNLKDAAKIYSECLASAVRLLPAEDQRIIGIRMLLAVTYYALGTNHQETVAMLEQNYASIQKQLGSDHPATLNAAALLAGLYSRNRETSKAIPLMEKMSEGFTRLLGEDHSYAIHARIELANTYELDGQTRKALAMMEALHERCRNNPQINRKLTQDVEGHLASSYVSTGQHKKAIPILERVYDEHVKTHGVEHPQTLAAVNNLAIALTADKQEELAVKKLEQAHQSIVAKFGAEHPLSLTFVTNLGRTYVLQHKPQLAIPLLEKALAIRQRRDGPDHADTLLLVNTLAQAYEETGQARRAIPLMEQSTEGIEKKLGAEHPNTLAAKNSLAIMYFKSGELKKAIELFERLRSIYLQNHGAEYSISLSIASNLAAAYKEQGQLKKALPLMEQVLETNRKKDGEDHPTTLESINNLAAVYAAAGQYRKAIPMLEKVQDAYLKKMGAQHATTLQLQNNLAMAYRVNGQATKALALMARVRQNAIKSLGAENPLTLKATGDLAKIYHDLSLDPQALPLLEQVNTAQLKLYGDQHPETFSTQNTLGSVYMGLGKFNNALAILEPLYERVQKKLGADHDTTFSVCGNLGAAYQSAGQSAKAVTLLEKARAFRVKQVGEKHPDLVVMTNNLATAYMDLQQYSKAIPLLELNREIQIKNQGPSHPTTIAVSANLANVYSYSGNVKRTIQMLEELQSTCLKTLGDNHEYSIRIGLNLSNAYSKDNQKDKAITLLKQLHDKHAGRLGYEHPVTINICSNLAVSYLDENRKEEAVALYEKIKESTLKTFGPDHPTTFKVLTNVARAYHVSGLRDKALPLFLQVAQAVEKRKYEVEHADDMIAYLADCLEDLKQYTEAETWRRKWLTVDKTRSGTESTSYATSLTRLGQNLLFQKKYQDAEALLRQSYAVRSTKQSDLWQTYYTQSILGESLLGQKKYSEAEPLLLAGYQGMKQREAKMHKLVKYRLADALNCLIQFYTETGKPDDVKKWQAEKEKLSKPTEKK